MAESDFIIAGLGNPGPQYEDTRHNAGFKALDHFASAVDCIPASVKCEGRYCRQQLYGRSVILAKPETFMNRSGGCIACLARYFKVPLSNILILHDDLDLQTGRVKVVARGGAGGHNGIRSLVQHFSSSDFSRVKIGIGRPEKNDSGQGIPVERYVLSRFSHEESKKLNSVFDITDQAIELFVTRGIDYCMNRINGK